MPLDYNNSVPLYIQLKSKIEENILNGIYKGQIPSEREIMDEYYVSRSTVRQAINELVHDGVLEKRPGKGTFISLKPINDWLGSLSSTTETIEKMGMVPGAKLVEAKVISLPGYLQKITGLAEAYFFKRIRYANQIPIGIENSFYSVDIGKKLIQYDLDEVAFYDLLELKLGIQTREAEQIIKASNLTAEDANLLGVPENSSVLNVNRKLLDLNGDFVEYEQAYYRGDMYSFKINLARNK